MFRTLFALVSSTIALSAANLELHGKITGAGSTRMLRVHLFGVETPYMDSAEANRAGEFRFHSLIPGNYTVSVLRNGLGEVRRTVVVSPAVADKSGVVHAIVPYAASEAAANPSDGVVSIHQLSIPGNAMAKYGEAQKRLAAHDPEAAVRLLEDAVAIAPQFSTGWNLLGVIAFQTGDDDRAEALFRKSLAADPESFEPLVNLGGVLVKKKLFQDALQYNQRAVRDRPEDALANAQLGITYFKLDQLDQAEQYLLAAKRLDPAHYSQPQIFLSDIYVRRGNRRAAIQELEDVLALRPDGPLAESIRHNLAQLSAVHQ